jgi:nicotinamide-nucleotide amidase
MTARAEILIIGREIVSGLRQDTNSAVIAARLTALGFRVERVTAIADAPSGIRNALAATDADLVVITGGLGSTRDDLTRPALARFSGTMVVEDAAMKARLLEKLAVPAAPFKPRHRAFCVRPASAIPLRNPVGLAEGLWIEVPGSRSRGRRVFCALPGVPAEMEAILGGDFVVAVAKSFSRASETLGASRPPSKPRLRPERRRVIGIAGLRESEVEDRLLERKEFRRGDICILPSPGVVHLVLPAGPLVAFVRRRLGAAVFTLDGERLEEVVVAALRKRGETLAVAESCTGGELGGAITSVAGSSEAFLGGVIAYHNRVKERALRVSAVSLKRYGAVSAPVAAAMARGARRALGADWALATTGVAGPGGGSAEKPVGLVYVALAGRGGVVVKRFYFSGTRAIIRLAASRSALDLLRLAIPRRA